MYPNPSDGLLYIETPAAIEKAEIYTLGGALVVCYAPLPDNQIDLRGLESGSYYIRLQAGGKTEIRKIVIIK
jgi:hypothetical protein